MFDQPIDPELLEGPALGAGYEYMQPGRGFAEGVGAVRHPDERGFSEGSRRTCILLAPAANLGFNAACR
jgi:hypothetical protein